MELTPKQQVSELIRQAQKVLLVTSRNPNNDQLAAIVALSSVLTKLGKQPQVVVSDPLPSAASILDTSHISPNLDGVRDFIVSLDMAHVEVDKLKYTIENGVLNITVTPVAGNFLPEDASFSYGAFQFDLVVALGVTSLDKIDRIHEQNPTMFDGLHLINIDYHRINASFGSVNLVDQAASSVCEMLISVTESLGQGLMDESIATALLTGIMSATANFTAPATTAKALTVAAQMMSAGAKQQEIVKVLAADKKPAQPNADGSKKKSQPSQLKSQPKSSSTPTTVSDQVLLVDELVEQATSQANSFDATSPLEGVTA
ncbi:DHH family phosphoesterase [bacterium]|nr:DHH family phosphoesterase [bacterium]